MSIFSKITNAFHFLSEKKVVESFAKTTSLINIALPIAKTVAALTPTRKDDAVIAAIEKWGVPVSVLTSQAVTGIDKILKDGARQKVVAGILRDELVKIVSERGSVVWGNEALTTVQQILDLDQSALEAVALQAYRVLRDHDPSLTATTPVPAVAPPPLAVTHTAEEIKAKLEHLREKLGETTDPGERALIDGKIEKWKRELEAAGG